VNIILALQQNPGSGSTGMLINILMFGGIFAIFYFMIIRPQQKRAKEREKMLSNMEKGDKVVTSGGIHGVIIGIEEKSVLLDCGNNVKLKFDRAAISAITKA
jgi:preprotein translocase subunit YajC